MIFRLYKKHDGSFDVIRRAANALGTDAFLGNRETLEESVDLCADAVGGARVTLTELDNNKQYIEYDAS